MDNQSLALRNMIHYLHQLIKRSDFVTRHNIFPVGSQCVFPKRNQRQGDIHHFFQLGAVNARDHSAGQLDVVFIQHVTKFPDALGVEFLKVVEHNAVADAVMNAQYV